MGKRKKSSKPQGPKKREPLATSFKCVFCNNETSVTAKIDKRLQIGTLSCKQCGQSYQTETNALSQAVDVYSDWIDACDEVAKEQAASAPRRVAAPHPAARLATSNASAIAGPSATEDRYDDEGDGFIDDDDADGEADYANE